MQSPRRGLFSRFSEGLGLSKPSKNLERDGASTAATSEVSRTQRMRRPRNICNVVTASCSCVPACWHRMDKQIIMPSGQSVSPCCIGLRHCLGASFRPALTMLPQRPLALRALVQTGLAAISGSKATSRWRKTRRRRGRLSSCPSKTALFGPERRRSSGAGGCRRLQGSYVAHALQCQVNRDFIYRTVVTWCKT